MDVPFSELKALLIENCMLRVNPEEISETAPLFDPTGLGLDSIDALQISVALEKSYGVAIKDAAVAREALQSLTSLRDWLLKQTATG